MQSDSIKPPQHQTIPSEFSVSGNVTSLLNFLEEYLPQFTQKISIQRNTDERIINQKLLRFFCSQSCLYHFIPENLDEKGKNKSKPDLGVYEKDFDVNGIEVYDDDKIRFFDIECKRLYNPSNKEYVHGITGGIQRFKVNKHGVDLPQSAMIGYVETNSINFWHEKINSWISDKNEHLNCVYCSNIGKFESEHIRINPYNSTIKLTHFWLKMRFVNN